MILGANRSALQASSARLDPLDAVNVIANRGAGDRFFHVASAYRCGKMSFALQGVVAVVTPPYLGCDAIACCFAASALLAQVNAVTSSPQKLTFYD